MPPKFRSGLGEDEKYTVSAKHFIAGEENVLAIRVYRKYPRGGFNVAAPIFTDGNKAISTKGKWQHIIGDNQDYSTDVCVECAPGFWNAIVKCQGTIMGIVFFIVIFELIFFPLFFR